MICPNCGHEIKPGQNFCDNCGLPLKKDINVSTKNEQPAKEDDSVRSLADIEKELDQQDKINQARTKAPTQEKTDDVDDRTRVYNFRDEVKHAVEDKPMKSDPKMDMAPAQKAELERQAKLNEHPKAPDNLKLDQPVHLDPVTGLPVYPDDKPLNSHTEQKAENNEDDGIFTNMVNFLKNNVYVDIIAVILVVLLFFIKRNYSWILLAIFLVAWFLTSQIVHGKEIKLNKLITHRKDDNGSQQQNNQNQPNSNYQTNNQPNYQSYQAQPQPTYNQRPESKKQAKREHREEVKESHQRNWKQKLIIVASIVAFIASITGPFVNGVSLSATIANAANVSVNLGVHTNLIMNLSSAVRFICFISPVIVLIAANFRNKGSIRIIRVFSMLASVIYIIAYVLFSTNVISASLITGQTVTGLVEIGTSFYVLIITSVLSLLLSYGLHPREKR